MDRSFSEQVIARLSPLGLVRGRSMFGGLGVYWGDAMFAIVHRDHLYFKVDDASRPDFEARGMAPFRPSPHQTLRSYHEVPPDVWADDEALLSWAREAIRASQSD